MKKDYPKHIKWKARNVKHAKIRDHHVMNSLLSNQLVLNKLHRYCPLPGAFLSNRKHPIVDDV